MAALHPDFSMWSQPWQNPLNVYGGLACNWLMADSWSDRTPLHEAAFQGRLLQLMTLTAQGFHVNTLTLDKVSPLHEACLGGHYGCAKFLLANGANPNEMSTDGATPLFNSCRTGSAACVKLLLDHGASVHATHSLASPIHEAAKQRDRKCLELLLSFGAPVDMELPDVGTPLYSACQARAVSCVETLLLSGADIRIGREQDSPLHVAVQSGGPDVVELLLDFGAIGSCRNAEGKTPLDVSLPNTAVRKILLTKGPCSLSQLCCFCIRRSLGRSRLHQASKLLLPRKIKDFLLYQ